MTKAVTSLGTCQVRSGTDNPCGRPAAVRMLGVSFCERCAREQEAYFAIGEVALARGYVADEPGDHGLRDEFLFRALNRMRRGPARYVVGESERSARQGAFR